FYCPLGGETPSMRVLITSSIYPTPEAPKIVGGAEIFVRRLAESLLDRGDSVEVIRAASVPDQKMETCNGIDVYSAPVENVYFPFTKPRSAPIRAIWHAMEDWQKTAQMVAARIQAFKPDILHSNNLSGLTTGVWKTSSDLGIPVLHTLHDYYLTCPRCSRFSNGTACTHTCVSCKILTINRRDTTKHLDAVVGVSQRILDIHTELGLFSDTPLRTVIRNASTADVGDKCTVSPDGTVTFGFIGRLAQEKGIYNLVQAVAAIPPRLIRLVIAGDVTESQQAHIKLLARNARIDFLGFVPPSEFYEQVDVVVVPSVWEDPSPLVVADAQAAGKPLLGTRFGGIPEVIEQDVTGWLTAPDPESLTASILKIMESPRQIADISRRLKAGLNKWTFIDVVARYRDAFEHVRQSREMAKS
ncbi:MAG: glycosyltransferase family 4 protein, partial [Bradyrhizobium sp.]